MSALRGHVAEGAISITREHGVRLVDQCEQALHEAGGRRTLSEPVMHPLALRQPLQQTRLAQDLQMTGDARLALTQSLSQVGDAQVPLAAQRQQPQSARLSGGFHPGDDF